MVTMSSTRSTIIAAGLLLLTHVAMLGAFGNHPLGAVLSDFVQLLLGLLCVLTSVQAFQRSGSVGRYFWRWLVVSFLTWLAAQCLGTYIDITSNHSIDFVDDLLFFGAQVPLGMLIFLDPDHESNHFDRLHWLDFLQVCVFLVSVYLYFSHGPGRLTTISLLGPFGWTRSLVFNLTLIAAFILRGALADSRVVRAFFGRMAAFLVGSAVADSYADFAPNNLQSGTWFDLVWTALLVIPVLIAVTWHQEEFPAAPPKRAHSFAINQFFPLLYPFFSMLLLVQVAHTHTILASAILVLSFAALCIRVLVIQHRLAKAQEALQHEAAHDALTGLPNRGAIFDILEKETQRFQRGGQPFGAIMADIDFFKRINDNYGHPTGDLVLQQVADKLKDTVRSYDSVGRYGGEEFLIITPNCDRGETLASAERLRRSIAELEVPTTFGVIPVRLSLGVVSASNREDCGCSVLLRRADDALYRAKANGRNRVEQAVEESHPAEAFVTSSDEVLPCPS